MNTEEFNDYCKNVMGYTTKCPTNYNPHVDLNQMSDVVDKLMAVNNRNCLIFVEVGCKQSFREFIISTINQQQR